MTKLVEKNRTSINAKKRLFIFPIVLLVINMLLLSVMFFLNLLHIPRNYTGIILMVCINMDLIILALYATV